MLDYYIYNRTENLIKNTSFKFAKFMFHSARWIGIYLCYAIFCFALFRMVYGASGNVNSFTGQSNPFNITFTGNQNQSFILPIPQYGYAQNVSLNILTTNSSSSSYSVCYQQFANVTTTCDGLGTGNYSVTLSSTGSLAIDGDYSTSGMSGHGTTQYVYINYTTPINWNKYTNYALFQLKTGTLFNNQTLPNECTNSNKVRIRIDSVAAVFGYVILNCFNNTLNDFVPVYQYPNGGVDTGNKIYDEAIFWVTPIVNASIYLNNNLIFNSTSSFISNLSINISAINNLLSSSQPINLTFHSDTAGILQVNLTNATYSYGIDNCSGIGIGSNATAYNISFYNTDGTAQSTYYSTTLNYGTTTAYGNTFSYANTRQNYSLCIYPAWANLYSEMFISYQNNSYSATSILFSNATQVLKLYLQQATTPVLFTVVDSSTRPVQNAFIYILKWNSATNTYLATETLKTDSNGEAIGNIVLLTDYYKFIVTYNGETRLVDPELQGVKLYTTTRLFRINLGGQEWFDNYNDAYNIGGDVLYNNLTSSFSFTWLDSESIADYGCLQVTRRNSSGTTTLSDNCVNTAAGSIVFAITPRNGSSYTGQGYLKINNNTFIIDTQEVKFNQVFTALKDSGKSKEALLFAFLLILALTFAGLPYPEISGILFIVGIIITSVMGLWQISIGMMFGIILMIGMHIYLGNKK